MSREPDLSPHPDLVAARERREAQTREAVMASNPAAPPQEAPTSPPAKSRTFRTLLASLLNMGQAGQPLESQISKEVLEEEVARIHGRLLEAIQREGGVSFAALIAVQTLRDDAWEAFRSNRGG